VPLPQTIQKIFELAHDGYIKPICNKSLVGVYLATTLGIFGMSLLDVFLAFDIASLGMGALLAFLLLRIGAANLVAMPLGLMALSKFSWHSVFIVFLLLQLSVLVIVFIPLFEMPQYLTAALIANTTIPFWVLYHAMILNHSSIENRGNEVSVAHLSMTLGAVAGSVTAGFLLHLDVSDHLVMILGSVLVICASSALYYFSTYKKGSFVNSKAMRRLAGPGLLKAAKLNPTVSKATLAEAVHDTAIWILWPVWLKVVGAGGLAVGILQASNVGVKFIISPIVGRFINLKNGYDSMFGPFIKLFGWLPWLVSNNPLVSLCSCVFFAAGSHTFKVGLETRWYENKTLSHLAVREIVLGIGRFAAVLFFVPVLFYKPDYFVVSGIACLGLLALSGLELRKSLVRQCISSNAHDQIS
jgi:hypothetical protein